MIARQGLVASILVASLLAASPAAADKKECAAAYVEGQKLKKDGAFKKAREKLIVCSKNECMAAVRKDCVAWLDEVNSSMASLVVEAKGPDGKETFDVRITENGEVVAEKLDVNAIELDPGTHKLSFEYAGQPPVEREVVLRQGQKNKVIQVSFEPEKVATPDTADKQETPVDDEGPVTVTTSSAPPVLAYVLGGVGVVALGAAGFFWLSASSAESDLEDEGCEPNCSQDDVDSIEQKRLFGDIALGVGVVSLGVAAYLFFSPREKSAPPPAAQLDVRMAPGGAFAGVSGHF